MTQYTRRGFMACVAATALVPKAALACDAATDCVLVPENSFRGGSINRAADCTIEFRLPVDILQAIIRTVGDPTGPAGTYDWTFRLITFRSGRPVWQQAHRVQNVPYRRQGVYFGTYGAVYITCDIYTGWLSTGAIRSCGPVTLRRVDWPFDWQQLEEMTS